MKKVITLALALLITSVAIVSIGCGDSTPSKPGTGAGTPASKKP